MRLPAQECGQVMRLPNLQPSTDTWLDPTRPSGHSAPSASLREGFDDSACSRRVPLIAPPTIIPRIAPAHQGLGISARREHQELYANATVFSHHDERRRGPPRTVMRPHRDDPRMGSIAASLGTSKRFKTAALESTNPNKKAQGQEHVATQRPEGED